MLAAEADGVDRDALAADGGDGLQVDAAGVIGAVAEQHDGSQRQRRGFRQHALQGVADARGGGRGRQFRSVFWMRSGSLPNLYRRTWNLSPSDFSNPLSSTDLAAASRVPEESAIDMLRESSTSTATTFCWGRSVATLNAGCHSKKRMSATMPVSSNQMATGRNPLSMP